jgi:hypothetical protein
MTDRKGATEQRYQDALSRLTAAVDKGFEDLSKTFAEKLADMEARLTARMVTKGDLALLREEIGLDKTKH